MVCRIKDAFFFGAVTAVGTVLDRIARLPQAMDLFVHKIVRQVCRVSLTGTNANMHRVFRQRRATPAFALCGGGCGGGGHGRDQTRGQFGGGSGRGWMIRIKPPRRGRAGVRSKCRAMAGGRVTQRVGRADVDIAPDLHTHTPVFPWKIPASLQKFTLYPSTV